MAPRSTHRTRRESELERVYADIPTIPACDGRCVESCGPITMFAGEWERVKRSAGRAPRLAPGSLTCPLLSPAGRCTVYSVRPYICRLWGTTPQLACPFGCRPERWLSSSDALGIFKRIEAIAGPQTDGPIKSVDDLWAAINLEGREQRSALIQAARDHQARIRQAEQSR